MLIVRHLGTPNSDFNGCHCMRDPVLYRSMGTTFWVNGNQGPRAIDNWRGHIFMYSSSQTAKTMISKEINGTKDEFINIFPLIYQSSGVPGVNQVFNSNINTV